MLATDPGPASGRAFPPPEPPTRAAAASAPDAAASVPRPHVRRAYACVCGQPVFFRNTTCLACGRALGYDARRRDMRALEPADAGTCAAGTEAPDRGGPALGPSPPAAATALPPDQPMDAGSPPAPGGVAIGPSGPPMPALWRDAERPQVLYRRCGHLESPSGCNWLIDADDAAPSDVDGRLLCRCCRQLRTVAALDDPQTADWFHRVEMARRRLVSSLIGLGLPVASRVGEDPGRGLAFDLLRSPPDGPSVVTGHADGLITIDLAEADDATREQRRATLHEPYRTLLGHLRHESGHYYQQRLVDDGPWVAACRHRFGDERADYGEALKRHYDQGPPADWAQRHVSAYASAHPWEDWAETWAHYLHLTDTLDTARSFGLDGSRVELDVQPFTAQALRDPQEPGPPGDDATLEAFAQLLRNAMEITGVLNELSRSMGMADPYPFALSLEAARKLLLVHRIVHCPEPDA